MSKNIDSPVRIKSSRNVEYKNLKSIVESFVAWYNSLFDTYLEDIKKYPHCAILIEDLNHNNKGFEINEETLYNVLTAEFDGNSIKTDMHLYYAIPTIPESIANVINLPRKTYLHKLKEHLKHNKSTDYFIKKHLILSADFKDTEYLFKIFNHLKVVQKFMENSKNEIDI